MNIAISRLLFCFHRRKMTFRTKFKHKTEQIKRLRGRKAPPKKQFLEKVGSVCYNIGVTLLKLPANGTEGTSWN